MYRTAILAATAFGVLAACSPQTREDALRSGARNGLIGAGIGAVAGAVTDTGAGTGAIRGGAIGVASGVLTVLVDELIYGPPSDGYDDYAEESSGDYDWGPYTYDPERAETILAEDRLSPDAVGVVPYPYPPGSYGGSPTAAAGVIVAERSPYPRDTEVGRTAAGAPLPPGSADAPPPGGGYGRSLLVE